MTDRRTPVKGAVLLAPLVISVLALHAWGDALSGGLGRAVADWQYPERDHAMFQVRVPRWSEKLDAFAVQALSEFVAEAVKLHGRDLGVKAPAQPIKVVLLDHDTDVRRYRWTAAEPVVNGNEALFDAATRTIYARKERNPQQEPMTAALRQAAARALLHDAGASRGGPWLTEGLVGRLEGAKPAALRSLSGSELPGLKDVLTARPADFQGIHAAAYARGAKLLVAFLMDARAEEFAAFYADLQKGIPHPGTLFANKEALEGDWKKWIQDQK